MSNSNENNGKNLRKSLRKRGNQKDDSKSLEWFELKSVSKVSKLKEKDMKAVLDQLKASVSGEGGDAQGVAEVDGDENKEQSAEVTETPKYCTDSPKKKKRRLNEDSMKAEEKVTKGLFDACISGSSIVNHECI